jgi:GntR family transcriptional repressor for pyruvate dehydrogenase complex
MTLAEGAMYPLQAIQAHPVSDVVAERILELVSSGTWRPGEQIPPQRTLAAQLGVSLSSVREALRSLAALGLIEIRHGQGTFVARYPAEPLSKSFDWALRIGHRETEELMEVRRAVEVSVAGLAARRASDEQIEQLSSVLADMAKAMQASRSRLYDELDIGFHLALAQASGNSLFVHLTQSLHSGLEQFIRLVPHTKVGLENHCRVVEAIRRRDQPGAEKAMRILLGMTERLFEQPEPGVPLESDNT